MKSFRAFLWIFPLWLYGQTARISGVVTDAQGNGLSGVNILAGNGGTASGKHGYFQLNLKPGEYRILFSHIGYETKKIQIALRPGEHKTLNVKLIPKAESIGSVVIRTSAISELEQTALLKPKTLQLMPAPTQGIKGVLLSLPSVTQLDELSSQYLVRGGNYDENAVYINGMEVFRPFLTRSGKQEGLPLVNPYLVKNIKFYAGGFPVRLGNKLSSVLDVQYGFPGENRTYFEAGLTGASLSFLRAKNSFRWISSLRYSNNYFLVKNLEGNSEYRPSFTDFQTLLRYQPSKHWTHQIFGYVSLNRYHFIPYDKITNFGTFTDARSLVIYYSGQEKDRFDAQMLAFRSDYKPSSSTVWQFTQSIYHTSEQEFFDILSAYFIGEPNPDLSDENYGDPMNLQALGEQLDHARNQLDAVIGQSVIQWKHKQGIKEWVAGFRYRYSDVRDRISEYQMIDSAGFFILPPASGLSPDEPYVSDTLPVLPFRSARSDYLTQLHLADIYFSTSYPWHSGKWKGRVYAGFRTGGWLFNEIYTNRKGNGWFFSPRILFFFKRKDWRGHQWRLSAGLHMQPPEYREFRNASGNLNPWIRAQKAWNFSLAHQWRFTAWSFPFQWQSEIYYRYIFDLNPYKIENIRIRYDALNHGIAYAWGIETRLHAELLPGTESWLSLAYMKTEENIDGRGWIPRPTDQRFKMALMFRDYVPGMPFLKMYLNNVFATGMPTGAPLYADPYQFQFRTRYYWRTDVGLYYELTGNSNNKTIRKHFRDMSIGFEIINMFNRRNSVSNLWIREIYTKRMMGVPNYLLGRIFNLKIKASW